MTEKYAQNLVIRWIYKRKYAMLTESLGLNFYGFHVIGITTSSYVTRSTNQFAVDNVRMCSVVGW